MNYLLFGSRSSFLPKDFFVFHKKIESVIKFAIIFDITYYFLKTNDTRRMCLYLCSCIRSSPVVQAIVYQYISKRLPVKKPCALIRNRYVSIVIRRFHRIILYMVIGFYIYCSYVTDRKFKKSTFFFLNSVYYMMIEKDI